MTTANVLVPQQGALSDLANWIAGDLGSGVARLYASNTVYAPTNTCSSYTQASFVGYTPAWPVWGAPFTNTSGKTETDSSPLTWTFTGSSGTATVFGIFVTDISQTKLLLVVPFLSPIVLSPTEPTITQVIQLTAVSEL